MHACRLTGRRGVSGVAPLQASSEWRTAAPAGSRFTSDSLEILWFGASTCGSRAPAIRRAACDRLRSGSGDSDLNDGPAARFAAEAARYDQELWRTSALRSEQALPAMGCAAAPAILIRTAILRLASPGAPRLPQGFAQRHGPRSDRRAGFTTDSLELPPSCKPGGALGEVSADLQGFTPAAALPSLCIGDCAGAGLRMPAAFRPVKRCD